MAKMISILRYSMNMNGKIQYCCRNNQISGKHIPLVLNLSRTVWCHCLGPASSGSRLSRVLLLRPPSHSLHLRYFLIENEKTLKLETSNDPWGPYLLNRIHMIEESSRFHGYSTLRWGVSILGVSLLIVYICRDQLRNNVADEVADVASRSMADENVIMKAHDMTKGVLERLTADENTVLLLSTFLRTVLEQDEVKNATVIFATEILNHPQTQEKLQKIVKTTLHSILNNKETKDLLLNFIRSLIEDQQTKETCNIFLKSLTKDPDIQKMFTEFFKGILISPSFQMEAVMLGREVTHKVVHDEDIQKQTGDALWSAVKYGITPYWFRQDR